jgi:recombination protein RecA
MSPAPKKKGKKEEEVELTINGQLDQKLASVKASGIALDSLFQYADEYTDLDVECISTGFPSLDVALHPKLLGLPRGRDIEVSSADGNVGKSTITRQIVKTWQGFGLLTGLAEPEKTDTRAYWDQLGIVTDRHSTKVPAMRIMRPTWDFSTEESRFYSAEQFLNAVDAASDILDLIVIDSVDALVQAADIAKDSEDNAQVGGIAKLLSEFFRKGTNKRATRIWVNQQRMAVGKFSPTGGTPMVTPGGKAIPFYSSIRMKGVRIQSLKEGDNDPYGFITEWNIFKNKIAPQDRKVKLPYIHGEGFSQAYDLFNLALKLGIIGKSGAWFQYPEGDIKKHPELKEAEGFLRTQGSRNFYQEMRDNPATLNSIKRLVEGEDVDDSEAEVEQAPAPQEQGSGQGLLVSA